MLLRQRNQLRRAKAFAPRFQRLPELQPAALFRQSLEERLHVGRVELLRACEPPQDRSEFRSEVFGAAAEEALDGVSPIASTFRLTQKRWAFSAKTKSSGVSLNHFWNVGGLNVDQNVAFTSMVAVARLANPCSCPAERPLA